jgi:hypothetical protein
MGPSTSHAGLSPEEAAARKDAPLRAEFVRRATRVHVPAVAGSQGTAATGGGLGGDQGGSGSGPTKKSRNQMKRVRPDRKAASLLD